jgi:2',3'-cyclic-nucleotide 3'-phosphodiesterase
LCGINENAFIAGELSFTFLYPNQRSKLHCTAFFGGKGRGQDPYINTYAKDRNVIEAMGKMHELTIIGFTMTLNTVGARVLLSDEELLLWYKDDDEFSPHSSVEYGYNTSFTNSLPRGSRAHMTLAFTQGVSAVQTGLDLLDLVRMELNNVAHEEVKTSEATLSYYDSGICYAHLDQPIKIRTIFSGSY